MLAVGSGVEELVKILCEGSANVNLAKPDGSTALHMAFHLATLNEIEAETFVGIAIVLRLHNGDDTIVNSAGKTPLDLATPEIKEIYTERAIDAGLLPRPYPCYCGLHMTKVPTSTPVPACSVCYAAVTSPFYCCCEVSVAHPTQLVICGECLAANGGTTNGVWVSLKQNVVRPKTGWSVTPEMTGVIENVHDTFVWVRYPGSLVWKIPSNHLQSVQLRQGLRVQIRDTVVEPRDEATRDVIGEIDSINLANGTVNVRFPNIVGKAWSGRAAELMVHEGIGLLEVGRSVKIRSQITNPRYTLGGIAKTDVGILNRIDHDGHVLVSYSGGRKWRGLVGEIEPVSAPFLDGVSLNSSSGINPEFVLDGNPDTFWQSTGSLPHDILFQFQEAPQELRAFDIWIGSEPTNTVPAEIQLFLGNNPESLHLRSTTPIVRRGWNSLVSSTSGSFEYIRLRVTRVHQNGRYCRINQVRLMISFSRMYPSGIRKWELLSYPLKAAPRNDAKISFEENALLMNRYKLIKQISVDNCGCVWQALDVQVKYPRMLRFMSAESSTSIKLFELEGLKLRSLQHPNIQKLEGFFKDMESDYHILVAEHIEGHSLENVVLSKGALPNERVYGMLLELLRAVTYAHNNQVMHRDIHPGSVLLRDSDSVVLTGFGGYTQLGLLDAKQQSSVYISPEGKCGDWCFESDFYSIGAVGVFLLTAQEPSVNAKDSILTFLAAGVVTREVGELVAALLHENPIVRGSYVKNLLQKDTPLV
eukprot:c9611_g1_i2.p1 GENE.c9611_g1_i2~~c9611_g1_i2.p1  ORF type:complete len:886 (+),score=234.65 c9611_g1_i2:389-2659(+)